MKRLLLLLPLLLPALAWTMEPAPKPPLYNAPSLKFLAAHSLGKHRWCLKDTASMPFKESQLNKEAVLKLEKIETALLPKELKEYASFMESHSGLLYYGLIHPQDNEEEISEMIRLWDEPQNPELAVKVRKKIAANHAEDAQTMLIDACRKGILDEKLLEDLRAINPNLNLNMLYNNKWIFDNNGCITPLACAASNRNITLIELLLRNGADINFSRKGLVPPAILFAVNGTDKYSAVQTIETIKTLRDHGVKLESIDAGERVTALYVAVQYHEKIEVVRFLLENGAAQTINHQDVNGDTALLRAAAGGINGATALQKNETALEKATREQKSNAALALLLEYKPLLEITNTDGETAFSIACSIENFEAMQMLKQAGANINHRNPGFDRTPLFSAIVARKNKVVAKLLEYGADVEAQDPLHNTPLILAAEKNNEEAVDLLLAAGAQIYAHGYFVALRNNYFSIAYKLLCASPENIPLTHPSEYFDGLRCLVKADTADNLALMNLLLRKGILNSFENYVEWKRTLLSEATSKMQELIKTYRSPKYHQSSWIARIQFDARQIWDNNQRARDIGAGIGVGGAAICAAAWYLLKKN